MTGAKAAFGWMVVLAALVVAPAFAQGTADYLVPWWTDENPHTGANGEQWEALRAPDFWDWTEFNSRWFLLMEWNEDETRWEQGPNNWYKDSVLVNANNQTPMSLMAMEVVTAGDYVWDGKISITGYEGALRTRTYAVRYAPLDEGGVLTTGPGRSANEGEEIIWDLGEDTGLADFTKGMLVGERLGLLIYSPTDVNEKHGMQVDFNHDPADPAKLVGPEASAIPGDANLDSVVDDADLSLLLANWNQDRTGDADGGWSKGEFDGIAPVQDADLSLLLANWSAAGAVPEPASALVMLLGAWAVVRRRK